ncbi:MAG TPA: gamma-glutamyl-phosphate reductase, partial [Verrucomicrobiae bacterium]|nr:gamma-glutamyl-phosphate reductase [Verrucomicrobiae bacterium]
MSILEAQMLELGQRARAAGRAVRDADGATRTAALQAMARRLRDAAPDILRANAEDVARGRANGLAESFIDRLALDEARLEDVAKGVDVVAA